MRRVARSVGDTRVRYAAVLMFARIRNAPLDYAWGSDGEITRLLGDSGACEPRRDGGPEAELWFGAHHGSPSWLADPGRSGGAADLRAWISADPATTLGPLAGGLRAGDGARLPFLMKVLAAASPLSLQAHPSLAHARAGFARENAEGLAADAPNRSYRDASHKPELLIAVSDTMETLAGFRRHADAVDAFERLERAAGGAAADDRDTLGRLVARVRAGADERGRRELVAWLLARGDDAQAATDAVIGIARAVRAHMDAGERVDGALRRDVETLERLADRYPGDPGVVIALLLHRVTLARGEAIFVSAGSMHAYVEGVGIEVMASSDNVLRGGLTNKHVDVPELLRVLDARETDPPRVDPTPIGPHAVEYRVPVADFRVVRVTRPPDAHRALDAPATVPSWGPAIAVCLEGTATIGGAAGAIDLCAGEAVYVTPDEQTLRVSGACDVVIATTGLAPGEPVPIDR